MRQRPEWIGKHPDQDPPDDVKLRIVMRQDGRCEGCTREFSPKLKPEFDHRPALCNGGQNRESMIVAVCHECHSGRTAADIKERAKTKRMQKARLGIDKPKPRYRKPDNAVYDWRRRRYVLVEREPTPPKGPA